MIKNFLNWYITKCLSNFTTYSFSLKHLWIMLTYRCNLNCKMCGLWGEEGIWKSYPEEKLKEEIPLNLLFKFLDEIKLYRPFVLLTGGEPLLSKNWYEVAKYLKDNKLPISISTNGTLLHHYAEKIVETIDNLDISIDGIGELHDRIRGKEGIFKKVEEGIEKVEYLKKEKKTSKPYLKISCTINNENFSSLDKVVEYLESKEIKIKRAIFRHLEYTDINTINLNYEIFKKEFSTEAKSLSGFIYKPEIDIEELINQIKNIKKRKYKNIESIEFLPKLNEGEVEKFYKNSKFVPFKNNRMCFAPYLGASILPNGEMWLCPDYVIGNIKDENFKKMWNNKRARNLRKRIKEKGLFPICHTCASLYVY